MMKYLLKNKTAQEGQYHYKGEERTVAPRGKAILDEAPSRFTAELELIPLDETSQGGQ
jgi:hypothetical protein